MTAMDIIQKHVVATHHLYIVIPHKHARFICDCNTTKSFNNLCNAVSENECELLMRSVERGICHIATFIMNELFQ